MEGKDTGDTTQTTEQAIKRLETENFFEVESFPQAEDFRKLAQIGNNKKLECGMQLILGRNESQRTIYKVGTKQNIQAPNGYHGSWKVFFHTHPEVPNIRSDRSVTAMTPSYLSHQYDQFMVGDIYGSESDMASGQYLNIVNSVGVSFMVGQEKHSHTAEITKKMRKKAGVADETSRPLLFVRSGLYEGEIVDEWTKENKLKDYLGDESHLVFSVRVPFTDSDYNMVFVAHEKLAELGITPEEMCFRNGVDTLVEKLNIDISHRNNINNAQATYVKQASI